MAIKCDTNKNYCIQRYLQQFILRSPGDISEHFGESHHCKNLNFENSSESQLETVSPGLVQGSCKDLCAKYQKLCILYFKQKRQVSLPFQIIVIMAKVFDKFVEFILLKFELFLPVPPSVSQLYDPWRTSSYLSSQDLSSL